MDKKYYERVVHTECVQRCWCIGIVVLVLLVAAVVVVFAAASGPCHGLCNGPG